MAGSKRSKIVKQRQTPDSRVAKTTKDPDKYYDEKPAWNFVNADQTNWSFTQENVGDLIWTEILPFLKSLERMTWKEILLINKSNNHSIDISKLNKIARNRLTEKFIEENSIISLRISATHRLYGYMINNVFNLLWYDNNHGDNETCVCRSKKKHT